MKIVVANEKIMANSILGEKTSKLWWYTTNDKIDVNKINKLIK